MIPRENFERELPIALIYCESRGMLADRVDCDPRDGALRAAAGAPFRSATSGCARSSADGLRLTANFALCQTMADQPSALFLCGRYHDRVVEDGGELRFAERICVYDSTIVPTSLVYPV